MSIVNEMRSRPGGSQSKGGGMMTMLVIVLLLLGVGGGAGYYLTRPAVPGPGVPVDVSGVRIGDPVAAAVFSQCVATRRMPRITSNAAVALYIRDHAIDLSDCAFQAEPGALCNADNRGFAVESAIAMINHTDPRVEAKSTSRNAAHIMLVRERVITAIGRRVGQGELVARDFGQYPPASLKAALATPATVDSCAKKTG